jgi:hypothetical protein
MAITKEQIIAAADALEVSGVKATMAAVREKLGSGSLATISPVLREWRESKDRSTAVAVIDIPSEVKVVLEKMGAEIWRSLSAITNDKILRIESEATAAIAEATRDRDLAIGDIEALEAQIKELLTCKASLESQVRTLDLQAQKLQLALDSGNQRNEILQSDIRELKLDLKDSQSEVFKLSISLARFDDKSVQLKQVVETNATLFDSANESETETKVVCWSVNGKGVRCKKMAVNVVRNDGACLCDYHTTVYNKAILDKGYSDDSFHFIDNPIKEDYL